MQAMILAAGYGTRLLPYTQVRPKPLFPILNQPLLCAMVARLRGLGCGRIIVNCHHLAGQIEAAVDGIDDLILCHEPAILGTGGSLAEVLRLIHDEPLLVINGDIYHSIDLLELYGDHRHSGREVSLALHDYPRFNKVTVANGCVTGFSGPAGIERSLAYTGVQVVNPDILATIGSRRPTCIIDHYRSLVREGTQIGYHLVENCYWSDIGTIGDYLQLHHDLLLGTAPAWAELNWSGKRPLYVDSRVTNAEECEFREWVCVGAARIGSGAVVSRSVVWDGAEIKSTSVITDRLIVPGIEV